MQTPQAKVSFKEQMHQARELAILQSACRLLGTKSFDAMTMDDVAHDVGIAKASLYKHFGSKEELCSAAMLRMMNGMQAYLSEMPAQMPALDKLKALLTWSLQRMLTEEMPIMPGRNSTLRDVLMQDTQYPRILLTLSDQIGQWVTEAQQQGLLDPQLPPAVVVYTLYARASDPVVCFLKEGGQYSSSEIVDFVVRTCFDGLVARTPRE